MPVFMRTFYIKSIEKALKARNEAEQKASKKAQSTRKRPPKSH
jgi:hypothetical protein